MEPKIIYASSAFKHGYTQDDIEQAVETKIYEDTPDKEDDIYIIIGFDTACLLQSSQCRTDHCYGRVFMSFNTPPRDIRVLSVVFIRAEEKGFACLDRQHARCRGRVIAYYDKRRTEIRSACFGN